MLILLVLCAFVAGFIDAIAGGGGLIQIMAFMLAGIPPVHTLATNKVVSCTGTLMAVSKYAKDKIIPWAIAVVCIIPCLIASGLGSKLVMSFSNTTITWLIIACIPIGLAAAALPRKQDVQSQEHNKLKAALILTPIGFYDGFLGPGAGTYFALSANRGLGISVLRSTGLAKVLNLSTNVAAVCVFVLSGKVLWQYGIPMAFANVLGAYFGSKTAVKYGDGFIKKVMIIMLSAMLIVNIAKIMGLM